MKYYCEFAVLLLILPNVFGGPSFCKKCHSEVESDDCFELTSNTPNESCSKGDNVSCFEMHYYDATAKKTLVERGCWPSWIQPNEDANICQTSKDKLKATGGKMLTCTQCTTDYCNSKSFPKTGVTHH